MKGDFTRSTFRPEKRFTGVRMQQGRVQLDADWNEQLDILARAERIEREDLIGLSGVPKLGGGFQVGVTTDGKDMTISAGRIYVDGTLCELDSTAVTVTATIQAGSFTVATLTADGRDFAVNEWLQVEGGAAAHLVQVTGVTPAQRRLAITPAFTAPEVAALNAAATVTVRRVTSYLTQPDYPKPPALPPVQGDYLVFVETWQRHLTALEEPSIRESALGGPDTATRTRTVWQVKLLPFPGGGPKPTCDTPLAAYDSRAAGTTGHLNARAQPDPGATKPCVLPPGGGFRRLENQLYRVEVRKAGRLVGGGPVPTFVWSRENGSVVSRWLSASGSELTLDSPGRDAYLGFAGGEWVELTDDVHELMGDPGTLVQLTTANGVTLTVDKNTTTGSIDLADFGPNAKLRRWDSDGELDVKRDNVVNDGWIAIEDGVEVRFEDGAYQSGDHWLIPARTADADVDWPRDVRGDPLPQPAIGIRRALGRLAVASVDAGLAITLTDCRQTFPSLTAICADDVCYDNTACALPGVETVQEALDRICQERDLRFHNRHLHGWGIVCGLRVSCGPDAAGAKQRTHVTVGEGYAIDCNGDDVLVQVDQTLDILKMAGAQESGPALLDAKGDGDLSLMVGLSENGPFEFTLEPFKDGSATDPQALLQGTLLMDVFDDCIRPLQAFWNDQTTVPASEKGLPAGPVTQRVAALTNLFAQAVNPVSGRNIFISPREDKILSDFYTNLKKELTSSTFCAMWDSARAYPAYPFKNLNLDTIFGKGQHTRIRIRPGGKEAYTVGPGLDPLKPTTKVNRYDLVRRVMLSEFDPLAGATGATQTGSGAVQDVAFSADGRQIYVIVPTKNDENTFFRAGEITATEIKWGAVVMICGVKLVTLATRANDKMLYAIGLKKEPTADGKAFQIVGSGLYQIDPQSVDTGMQPLSAFNAFGHLVITPDGEALAAAAAENNLPPTSYTRVVRVDLSTKKTLPEIAVAEGIDDIAVNGQLQGGTLYTLAGLKTSNRTLLAYDLATQQRAKDAAGNPVEIALDKTSIRMATFVNQQFSSLILTFEDDYCARVVDMKTNALAQDYLLPLQVGPIAIASDVASDQVLVLNYVSNTVTVAAGELFQPTSNKQVITQLGVYRADALGAFADLTAGFLQYLKDCLCDHLARDCPSCTGNEKLYLAAVSVRANQVYKICNFSKRHYVKSFPTMGYWLSLFPIQALVGRMVQLFCCAVLPELSAKYNPGTSTSQDRLSIATFRDTLSKLQVMDVPTLIGEIAAKANIFGQVSLDSISAGGGTAARSAPAMAATSIVGQPVDTVRSTLEERGVTTRSSPYAPTIATRLPDPTFFRNPVPGSEVHLYEEAGQVRYYEVTDPISDPELQRRLGTLHEDVRSRDTEILQLRGQVDELRSAQADLLQVHVPAERVAALETELKELRAFRQQVTRFMRAQPKNKR